MESLSLLDVFMPEDLCARCAEEEASNDWTVVAARMAKDDPACLETAKLAFCSYECKTAFVVAWDSIGKFPVA